MFVLLLVIVVPYGTFGIEATLHEPYWPLLIINVTVYELTVLVFQAVNVAAAVTDAISDSAIVTAE